MTRQGTDAIRAALRGYDPSDEQWDAITASLGPQAIVAGAGSGKTAVMTARIVHLVEEGEARPSGVLGLTFTNKAASELEERLTAALGKIEPAPREAPTVLTYHAFAAQIVREHGPRIGIDPDAALLSHAQKWQMLLDLVEDLPTFETLELRHPLSFIPQTLSLADQCADHLLTAEDLEAECDRILPTLTDNYSQEQTRKRRDLAAIVRAYTDAKRLAGRIDFGDQIVLAVKLLEGFADVAAGYRERFGVVLLDEYQDTNPAQRVLLQHICPPGSAVTAVGDARQAIYAWRGASMYNLIDFPAHFPGADGTPCEPTSLAENFRSGRRIVEVANAVIADVPVERRPGKDLAPVEANGEGWVGAGVFSDQDAEAAFIADEIERLHAAGDVEWRDFAILLRKRRYMDHIVATLERRDIPVEIPELGGLLKVPPVVDTVAWLRVLYDPGPSTNRWLARILMGPRYRIHYRDLAPISRWAAASNYELMAEARELLGIDEPDPGEVSFSLLEALDHADDIEGVTPEASERIRDFRALVDDLRPHATRPLLELAQLVIDRTGIASTLAASPARSAPAMARNLQTFLGVCSEFSPLSGDATLGAFLDYLDAAEESEDPIGLAATAPSDSVKVMTVHSAKGLEFECVFLPVLAAEEATNKDGWRKGSVFPDVRTADPMTSTTQLPPGVRADSVYLPKPEDHRTKAAYRQALKDRALEDERRLFYVAVTRAKQRLYCSAAYWYGAEPPKGPSAFCEEVAEHPGAELFRSDEAPPESPVVERLTRELQWPPAPRAGDETHGWVETVEALVAGRASEEEVLARGGDRARTLLDDHLRLLDSLGPGAEEGEASPGRPASLPATAAVRIAVGVTTVSDVVSPLPQRPTEAQRIGIEVHAWIEERARGLVGLAEEDALDETSLTPDRDTVEDLRESYLAMGYDERPLATLEGGEPMAELPFTLKVGETLVRGRIDAVFETDGGGLEVVDFKTGDAPADPDWGQLELYAEALAELGLADGEVTLTFAYLRPGQPVSKAYSPRGLGWLEEALA